MKNLFYTFIVLFFCASQKANAQDEDSFNKNQLKLEMMRLINPVNPGVELAYEHDYYHGFLGTQISATYVYSIKDMTVYDKLRGFRIGIEQKWFYSNPKYFKRTARPYVSILYQYQNSKFNASSFFLDSTLTDPLFSDGKPGYIDTFNGTKTFHAFNVTYGVQFVKQHFVFEFNAGIGGKTKVIRHYNRINPSSELYTGRHGIIQYESLKDGTIGFINIVAQLKLGYCF